MSSTPESELGTQQSDGSPAPSQQSTQLQSALQLSARERKLESLKASNLALEKQIAQVQAKHDEGVKKLKNPAASETVKQHIKLLHDFNEIRDVGLGLIGMVAENRQRRVGEVMSEFGVSLGD
ncbi:Swi5-domain-containing protein [Morchella conica CCBAS932]|uniref:Swi5-domain-containing protein n=1 Tax=Morchella conica CCBAS932 TaxID=1392247 RepID=A0A3N4KPR0_9PEZI|nr:Swi5-domain-containing protein [Morchella conica CCBAS932]